MRSPAQRSKQHSVAPSGTIGVGTLHISAKAKEYVNDVLNTERLSYGPYLQEFEKRFAAAHDCRFAVMTNSGTSSLMIALYALKLKHRWQDGDEVILPAVTFVATANIVIQLNLKPVFVDVDPHFYELDSEKVLAAITPRTRAMIPVHLFGLPCDMEALSAIAKKHNLRLIEDSCETMFTRYQGKSVGSLSDIGCFSTYVAHLLTTGVGGLCTTNDPELAVSLRSLANHGRDSIYLSIDDDDGKNEDEMRMIIQKRFSFITLGYSFRVTEMEGALGLAQLEEREPMMRARWENANYLMSTLSDLQEHLQLPTLRANAGHAFMMFPIVLRKQHKKELLQFLEANGIETRDMLPLVNQPVYRELLGTNESDYPVAKWINENGFYVGCHQGLKRAELDYISQVLHRYFTSTQTEASKSALVVLSRIDRELEPRRLNAIVESLRVSGFDEYILADASLRPEVGKAFAAAGFHVTAGGKGKGESLRRAVETSEANHFVAIGVDGAEDPRDALLLLNELRRGGQLVVASRFVPGGQRQVSRRFSSRSLGNRLFSFLLSIIFGENVTDGSHLLRGFTRDVMLGNPCDKSDDVMFSMTADALARGVTYTECPTTERKPTIEISRSNRFLAAFRWTGILLRHCVWRKK